MTLHFPRIQDGIPGISSYAMKLHISLYEMVCAELGAQRPKAETFYRNAVLLHESFFSSIVPRGSRPSTEFERMVQLSCGSWDTMISTLKQAVLANNGWGVLGFHRDELTITEVVSHDFGVAADTNVLLALDGWEHAYWLDFGTSKSEYVDTLFDSIDWMRVSSLVEPFELDMSLVRPVRQKFKWSCGTACLRSVLAAFGKKVTERQLVELAGTTTSGGTTAEGIVTALDTFGVRAERRFSISKNEMLDLLAQKQPIVLDVTSWGGMHWVVVHGTKDEKDFLVMDPAIGMTVPVDFEVLDAMRWSDGSVRGGVVVQSVGLDG